MARGRKPRTWVRLDCEGILRGSINYLLPLDGQAIWIKMIAYSEVCGGRPGFIEDNNQNGLPHEHIAHELHCPLELLESVLETMKKDGAIKLNGSSPIELINFKHYQFTEYDRQKPYRDRKREAEKAGKKIHKVCSVCQWKGLTNETYCPECSGKDRETELVKDYKAGKHGDVVES